MACQPHRWAAPVAATSVAAGRALATVGRAAAPTNRPPAPPGLRPHRRRTVRTRMSPPIPPRHSAWRDVVDVDTRPGLARRLSQPK